MPASLCAACLAPLRDRLARATDIGWTCAVPACSPAAIMRARRQEAADKFNTERLEDVTWMAEHGENLSGAAARLGTSPEGLAKWLRAHGHHDLRRVLYLRDPIDHNAPAAAVREARWAS